VLRQKDEEVFELSYRPGRCTKDYRVVALRESLSAERGETTGQAGAHRVLLPGCGKSGADATAFTFERYGHLHPEVDRAAATKLDRRAPTGFET